MNKKVLILTGKAGQGHISIAKSLEYWMSQWGMEPTILDILPGYINTTYKVNLKARTHQPFYRITNNRYFSKLMLRGFNGSLEERIQTLCPSYQDYDTVVSTHPLVHPDFAKTNIIILPDPAIHDLYLAAPHPQYYISLWKQDRRYEFLGPLTRKGFYNELKYKTKQGLKKECGFDPNKTTGIILAGGEWINKSQDYIDMLGYAFDPEKHEFIFVCGKNERFRQEAQRWYSNTNLKFLGWMDDAQMNAVLRAGDYGICFSTGSGVVAEVGACRLPVYIIDTLGAQENGYIQILEKNGVGRYIKGSYWEKMDRLKELIPQTNRLFDKNLNRWGDYLMTRPRDWEDFFAKKVLRR